MNPSRGWVMPSSEDKKIPYIENDAASGSSFVPHSFALEKLKIASTQYFDLKMGYEKHILELKESHDNHSQQTQIFYEGYIKEMKSKAKQHVEGQSMLKKEMLDSLRRQVADSEEVVERLRDQITDLRLTFQEESRALRLQLTISKASEATLKADEFDNNIRNQCNAVMTAILVQIDASSIRISHIDDMTKATAESEYARQLMIAEREQNTVMISKMETDHECRAVMQTLLLQIESDAHQEESRKMHQLMSVEQAIRDKCSAAENNITLLNAEIALALSMKTEEESRQKQEILMTSEDNQAVLKNLTVQYDEGLLVLRNEHEKSLAAVDIKLDEMSTALITAHVEAVLATVITEIESIHFIPPVAVVPVVIVSTSTCGTQFDSTEDVLLEVKLLKEDIDRSIIEQCVSDIVTDISDKHSDYVHQLCTRQREQSITTKQTVVALELQVKELLLHIQTMAEAEEQLEKERETELSNKNIEIQDQINVEVESDEIIALRLKLSELQKSLLVEKNNLVHLSEQKSISKSIIVEWVAEFEKLNDRVPVDTDKVVMREQYKTYKSDTKKVKTTTTSVENLEKEIADNTELLRQLTTPIIPSPMSPERIEVVEVTDPLVICFSEDFTEVLAPPPLVKSVSQLNRSERSNSMILERTDSVKELVRVSSTMKMPGTASRPGTASGPGTGGPFLARQSSRNFLIERGPRPEDVAVIEGLEDRVYQLQQDLELSILNSTKITDESLLLSQQLEAMTREKRTDVIKRYEDEVRSLKVSETTLQDTVTELKTIKSKNDA